MSSPLHKYPQGLLGRFNLKTRGDAPNEFGTIVMPVYDVGAEYAYDTQQVISSASENETTLGGTVTLTVPERVAYDILAVSFYSAVPGTTSVLPMTEINISGVAVAFTTTVPDTVRGNPFEVNCVWQPPQRFLLGPGGTINGIVRSTPNSTIACLLRALVRIIEL